VLKPRTLTRTLKPGRWLFTGSQSFALMHGVRRRSLPELIEGLRLASK